MRILFLGDVIGLSGCKAIAQQLPKQIKKNKIDFVIVNGENSAEKGVGITEKIANTLFASGVNVITSGNHIWDQKETMDFIREEKRLLRPWNWGEGTPGSGFEIFEKNNLKIGVMNLMGNVYMKKTDAVFPFIEEKIKQIRLKQEVDFLLVDIHAEITSEKQAMGYFLDGKATLVGQVLTIPEYIVPNGDTISSGDITFKGSDVHNWNFFREIQVKNIRFYLGTVIQSWPGGFSFYLVYLILYPLLGNRDFNILFKFYNYHGIILKGSRANLAHSPNIIEFFFQWLSYKFLYIFCRVPGVYRTHINFCFYNFRKRLSGHGIIGVNP